MQRLLVIGVMVMFWGLIIVGIVRQMPASPFANTAVPTLVTTSESALLRRPNLTMTPAIPPTFTPPSAAAPEPQNGMAQTVPLPTTTALASLNGIPLASIIVMSPAVVANAQAIFVQGQTYGRNSHAYAKVGDSTIQNPHFMTRFDEPGGYNLGPYAYLQPTIDYFAGSHSREGTAVRRGLHAWTVLDPLWADKTVCQPHETPIACEIRLHNPAILLIRLGSNDAGVPDSFDQNVRQVVTLAVANGVIPVIGTKADRFEGSNINNDILRQIAADYQVPLWDFDVAAQMIPGRGLDVDNIHLSAFFAHDYSLPVALERGHGVHNLTALMMLHALLTMVMAPQGE